MQCLIPGSSSGIGAETARELVRKGCHVALTGRDEQRLVEVAEECQLLANGTKIKVRGKRQA